MENQETLSIISAFRDKRLSEVIKDGGIVGAGGAGFPTYVKYSKPQPYHLTNAQESEPGYYIDKWLHKVHAEKFAKMYRFFLEWGIGKILIAPKYKDREWFLPLEKATGGRVFDCRDKNPINPENYKESILFTYTDDTYAFGKEQATLRVTAGVKMAARDLPVNHGFIVNNSETLYNIYRLLFEGHPVISKFVHVYGETPQHVFTEVPLGTMTEDLLLEAGTSIAEVEQKGHVIIDGGPGWFSVVEDPYNYAVTKRVNSLIVVDPEYVDLKRKDIRDVPKRKGYPRHSKKEQEQEPRGFLQPDHVRVQLVDGAFEIVKPAQPKVVIGDYVEAGEVIAAASKEGFSVPQHAPISGIVADVTERWIHIQRSSS
jgi:electron transport complex protein RnfC